MVEGVPSIAVSGDDASFEDELSLEFDVGVGERGSLEEGADFSETALGGGGSWGDGSFWMTFSNSLLVRIAADWIIGT